jgi:hypothetical protein
MEYQVNRKVWQILWNYILRNYALGLNNGKHFENDIFECKSYIWDEDDIENNDYHFYHKPSGFKIRWYKYALRGAYCNMNITDSQFVDILYDCFNSISIRNGVDIRFIQDVDRWWDTEGEMVGYRERR